MAYEPISPVLTPEAAEETSRICPEVPQTIDRLGLPRTMVIDLALRYLREQTTGTITTLRRALKLSFPVADEIFQHLRQQQLIDVKRTAGSDYVFSLTSAAQRLAAERSLVCRYAGPAPVPLDQYRAVVRSQKVTLLPDREQLADALRDLVLPVELIDQVGAAVTSGRPVFVYGPSGTGKTSLIERLSRLFEDTVLVPYCVEVDGHIISVFDPTVHEQPELEPDEAMDQRWIRCRRPCVIAGGELVPEMLSLRLDNVSGLYAAPLQMKAANGIFGIDDFGRQAISPAALFNRMILPLDRKLDNLSLQYGYMFQVPFEVLLVFSTNLNPTDLADEAFFRRVSNKIYVGPLSPEVFDRIAERVLTHYGIPFESETAACLRKLCAQNGAPDLRACQPGDICGILASLAYYERRPFSANPANLARAARLYFMQSQDRPA